MKNRVKLGRIKKDLTQAQLAKRVGADKANHRLNRKRGL